MSAVAIGLLGCVGILLFDAVASIVSRRTRVPYAALAPGSFAIYVITGFFAGGAADSMAAGAAAGAAVAAVEATLGWRVARALGADSEDAVTERMEIGVATVVTVSGAALGALGGLLA